MSQAGDPFFDALQALQPDVDVVVLPPASPVDAPHAGHDDMVAAVRATADVVLALLAEADLDGRHRTVHQRWERRSESLHVHVTRVRVDEEDATAATAALLRLGDVLDGGGWQPQPVDSPTPWLVASSPAGLTADVAVERSQLVVTVTGPPYRLTEDPR